MRAMILAAGLGTRLRPLTFVRPKVMVPILGMTVLEFWIRQLHAAGCEAVVVNAYHLKERFAAEVQRNSWPIPVEVRLEPVLLGTGGGIRNAMDFFRDEPFVVINGDIICKAPLRSMYDQHRSSGSMASLLLHNFQAFNNVAVNGSEEILGFGREAIQLQREGKDVRLLAFTGIHFIDPGALSEFPPDEPWEILAAYRKLIGQGTPPHAMTSSELMWDEMGSIEAYLELNHKLSRLPVNALRPLDTGIPFTVHPTSCVSPGASLEGWNIVGRRTRIMEDVYLRDSILWDDVIVKRGSRLVHCIVADGVVVEGEHSREVLIGAGPI